MAKNPTTRIWLKRGIIASLVIANLMIVYALWQLNQVTDQIRAFQTVPEVGPVLDEQPVDPSDPITFLILGSDSRENLPDDWVGDFGDFAGQRADVIMLARIVPATGQMYLLSLPRDLRTNIDGYGVQKINAAYAFGGAALMVSTVRAELGVPIHHYAEIDFFGFAGLVDQLGGIELDFPFAARDLKSGLSVEAGPQTLDGRMALAYARSRSYQEFRDGAWTSVDANDIGRTKRQQALLAGILGQMRRPSNILGVNSLVGELAEFMVVDPDFGNLDLMGYALAFREFGGNDLDGETLPTVTQIIDGIYFEVRDEPGATDVISAFRGAPVEAAAATTSTTAPVVLQVGVANGHGGPGAASEWAATLMDMGFEVVSVSDHESFDVEQTRIVSPAGSGFGAQVFEQLGFGALVDGAVDGYDVLVIIGADALDQPG